MKVYLVHWDTSDGTDFEVYANVQDAMKAAFDWISDRADEVDETLVVQLQEAVDRKDYVVAINLWNEDASNGGDDYVTVHELDVF